MARKPVTEMTDDELHAEWQAGMRQECEIGLTEDQDAYLREIEREIERRPDPVEAIEL